MVYYIILDVIPEVLFEDNLMFYRFNNYKNNLIERNRFRDKEFHFSENIKLKGVNDIMMIKLQEKEPYLIGRFWFIIFTILSLASLYKLYIRIISIYQNVRIEKLISTNNIISDERFNIYNHKVQFLDKTFSYGENNEIVVYNNDQNVLHVNNNINININNEQLNINNINRQFEQKDSFSTERDSNISNKE